MFNFNYRSKPEFKLVKKTIPTAKGDPTVEYYFKRKNFWGRYKEFSSICVDIYDSDPSSNVYAVFKRLKQLSFSSLEDAREYYKNVLSTPFYQKDRPIDSMIIKEFGLTLERVYFGGVSPTFGYISLESARVKRMEYFFSYTFAFDKARFEYLSYKIPLPAFEEEIKL